MFPITEGDILLHMVGAVVFGLAAVWLLSPYLARQFRFLAFLGTFVALGLAGILAGAVEQEWISEDERIGLFISVAVFGLVLSLAIHLAGWCCRGRYGPLRLSLWLFTWVGACWVVALVVLSICLGHGSWWEMVMAWLAASAMSFGILLPFLLLSFLNGFFRERLQEFLRLKPMKTPLTLLAAEASQSAPGGD